MDKEELEPKEQLRLQNKTIWSLTYSTTSSISGEPTREKTSVLTNVNDTYQDLDSNELQEIEEDPPNGCKSFGFMARYDENIDKGEFHVNSAQRDWVLASIKIMNGRYLDGRKIPAYILDEKDLSENELETNGEIEYPVERNGKFIDDSDGE